MIIADLKTPYYAVIFTTLLTKNLADYEKTAIRMEKLAELQEGFLGIESARNEVGITVSYWNSLEAITKWKHNLEHTEVRKRGRKFELVSFFNQQPSIFRNSLSNLVQIVSCFISGRITIERDLSQPPFVSPYYFRIKPFRF